MIPIPEPLRLTLEAGVTTLAWCWIAQRRDGAVFGFTDHDRALTVAGVACQPGGGFEAGEMRAGDGAARGAVFGVMRADGVSQADLDNGLWDQARVEVWRVDWRDPALNWRTFTGELGAVRRGPSGFEAELSGLSARLDRLIGRVFARACDAELGDERCGVDLDAPGWRGAGTVTQALAPGALLAGGLESFAPGWFARGVIVWTSGANTGARQRVTAHRHGPDGAALELDPVPAAPVQAGDGFEITAGCDKRFETCAGQFSNAVNFRGCPHMPGNDLILRAAGSEAVRDGGKR
ncbi:DUF2163 domain-containing protein [Alkalicaulis satelles]|uniref:DUF2163 domain-containing protein n=1 Tax=Alkalicaulis satelles TaxID=2609175 RepID=A0A5M6ZSH1_9PROT|nr:DUF2163 domain-containing protein [Alkalicaulis satelles]KAA5805261.1 DUF2163 domain-containing protein [Alkalicaulis satelles]